jgi:hypothetical protein
MKIILSRKGFDSSSGGVPSPIMPDGRLISLPIPYKENDFTYEMIDLTFCGDPIGKLVNDLTRGKLTAKSRCHFDPDLNKNALKQRPPNWRASFGQSFTAQQHLCRQNIQSADLFLFFGWFHQVEREGGEWRFVRKAPNLHVIYGWLLVESVLDIAKCEREQLAPWEDHPHVKYRNAEKPPNCLYVAADRFQLGNIDRAGGGFFEYVSADRKLTDPRQDSSNWKRSCWRLPGWFHPSRSTTLSYHSRSEWWGLEGDDCTLSTVGRGQEFVLSLRGRSPSLSCDATDWLQRIFVDATPSA